MAQFNLKKEKEESERREKEQDFLAKKKTLLEAISALKPKKTNLTITYFKRRKRTQNAL